MTSSSLAVDDRVGGSVKETNDRVALLSDVLRSFADATTDYARLLETIAERTARFLGHATAIRLLTEDGRFLESVALCDPIEGAETQLLHLNGRPIRVDERSAIFTALTSGRGFIMGTGIDRDINYSFEDPAEQDAARALDLRGMIAAPMRARDETLGILFVVQRGATSKPLTQQDLELAEGLASHAALAISNARILRQLKIETEERRRAELSLADAELTRRFKKSIIDSIPHPILVLTTELQVRTANAAFYALFNTTEKEVLNRSIRDIAGGALDTPAIMRIVGSTDRTRVVTNEEVHLLSRTMLANTRVIDLQARPNIATTILLSLEDITERLDNAEKLRRRGLLLDAMNEAVISGDQDFRISDWNPAAEALFGFKASEVVGRLAHEVLTTFEGFDREETRARLTAGETVTSQMRVQNRAGTWIDVSFSTVPVRSPVDGSHAGFVTVMQDISSRLKLEREIQLRLVELEVANRELEGFSYSISHDLRAPIRAIQGFARILREDHGTALDEEGLRIIGVIGRNAHRMGRLIDDLLRFVRLGRQSVEAVPVDMNTVIQEALENLHLEEREVYERATIAVEPNLPAVRGSRALLVEVWQQLIGNALKFSRLHASPRVDITTSRADMTSSVAVYRISDNGVGFEMRYATKVFGMFERLHPTTDFEGTGVGLALVERIVERHSGRVWVESEIGKGASFYVSLPSVDVEPKSRDEQANRR